MLSDPPYAVDTDAVLADLRALTRGWLRPDALVVVERSSRSPEIDWPAGYSAMQPRKYGETRIEMATFD